MMTNPLRPIDVDCPKCHADRTAGCYDLRANRDSPYSTIGDRGIGTGGKGSHFHKERIARARALAGGI